MATPLRPDEMIDHAKIDAAHEAATRETLLEHARMGRSVSQWRDGKAVWVTPAEIFARYGLDENGRPRPEPEYITDPDILAQFRERERLNVLLSEGKLDQYFGQYLIAGEGRIFAHGPSPLEARREAEPKAAAVGVPAERLTAYRVPGPELSVATGTFQ